MHTEVYHGHKPKLEREADEILASSKGRALMAKHLATRDVGYMDKISGLAGWLASSRTASALKARQGVLEWIGNPWCSQAFAAKRLKITERRFRQLLREVRIFTSVIS